MNNVIFTLSCKKLGVTGISAGASLLTIYINDLDDELTIQISQQYKVGNEEVT